MCRNNFALYVHPRGRAHEACVEASLSGSQRRRGHDRSDAAAATSDRPPERPDVAGTVQAVIPPGLKGGNTFQVQV